jgi:DNA-binding response OmpR family regulator
VKALELIQSNEIDLVISDVMMPGMDGLTLCKLVKNDVATSHIHMLMLTAKNTTEDRIDCYNAGADAYIAKPFELKVLRARVKNLISKRVQKAETFKSNQEINISSMEYCSIDELFLKQAVKNVEEKNFRRHLRLPISLQWIWPLQNRHFIANSSHLQAFHRASLSVMYDLNMLCKCSTTMWETFRKLPLQ